MKFAAAVSLLLAVAVTTAVAALPRRASVHGPQPGHTGGFGEPTCHRCHFDGPEHTEEANVTIAGLPAAWKPGETYRLTVHLQGTALRRGGFQLAVRHAEGDSTGRQAGTLAVSGSDVAVTDSAGISYIRHRYESTLPRSAGVLRWEVMWTAPAVAAGAVAFHVAANVANDDNSEFGDLIVTAADTVRVRLR